MFDLKVAPADQFQMRTRSVSIGSPFTGEEMVIIVFSLFLVMVRETSWFS